MANLNAPAPGSTLNNDELTATFLCSPQGGMRRSTRTNTLVIVSNHVESVYDDRWIDNVLHYTGMGQLGNQSLEFNQNKTLNESPTNGVSVHLFEVFTKRVYTYIGEVELADSPYQEQQPDAGGQERSVWVFPLRLRSGDAPVISEGTLKALDQVKEKQARKLSDAEVEALAKKLGQATVGKRNTNVTVYQRSPWVAENARRRANGKCELCRNPAPFNRKDGSPYLETHHIEWLANGGTDTVENTVSLCPNCHKKMHVVNSELDRTTLSRTVTKPRPSE
ncbi:HNH endonuclease [Stutzerimonas xanthomarina]|uniref:HNH endonuclease n=1 Tax=Stutzerimonas xanthomarina TaxID=271420 RepID=UPI0029A6CDD1|nr:HNH endonuclease [Stutzerimonas xanthomarina]MDX2354889.1 HNH endonuclease [Stutzerimonas xanthomarina]